MVVVQGEQHAILAALQVQFQVIGAEIAGGLVGGGSGFRASKDAPRWAITAGCGMPKCVARAAGPGSLAACAWPRPSSRLSSKVLLLKVTGMVEILSQWLSKPSL
jgi:hypothetical protein